MVRYCVGLLSAPFLSKPTIPDYNLGLPSRPPPPYHELEDCIRSGNFECSSNVWSKDVIFRSQNSRDTIIPQGANIQLLLFFQSFRCEKSSTVSSCRDGTSSKHLLNYHRFKNPFIRKMLDHFSYDSIREGEKVFILHANFRDNFVVEEVWGIR